MVFTIFTDWITKQWALSALEDGHRIPLLPTSSSGSPVQQRLLVRHGRGGRGRLIGIGVIGMVVYLAVQLHRATIVHRVVFFSIILGGAIGNLLDRIFAPTTASLTGSVVDFIDVSWFAVFNVADIYVVCAGDRARPLGRH
ncbi:MAG: signal peptidase II [Acidimicrobiales bacterium]